MKFLIRKGADLNLVASKGYIAHGEKLTPRELAQATEFEPMAIFNSMYTSASAQMPSTALTSANWTNRYRDLQQRHQEGGSNKRSRGHRKEAELVSSQPVEKAAFKHDTISGETFKTEKFGISFEQAVHLVKTDIHNDYEIMLRQLAPQEVFIQYGPEVSAFVFDMLTMASTRVLERMPRITTFCSMQLRQTTKASLSLS